MKLLLLVQVIDEVVLVMDEVAHLIVIVMIVELVQRHLHIARAKREVVKKLIEVNRGESL